MHVGRGGWTWYTGSAGWMYQAAIHELLGLRRRGATLSLNPCVPVMWLDWSIDLRHGRSRYRIVMNNGAHRHGGVETVELDGIEVDANAIPLVDDGETHEIVATLGSPAGTRL